MNEFSVQQIDHVEIFVPDQYEAAQWYAQVLGLHIVNAHEHWAAAGGPLMISSDRGKTMVALFNGNGQVSPDIDAPENRAGLRRIAFRTDAAGFRAFLDRLGTLKLHKDVQSQTVVTPNDVVDHGKSWSIYFSDPYGNKLEVTTYDYSEIAGIV